VCISVVITRLKKVSKFLSSKTAIISNLSVCVAPYLRGCRRRIEVICKLSMLRRAAVRLVARLNWPHALAVVVALLSAEAACAQSMMIEARTVVTVTSSTIPSAGNGITLTASVATTRGGGVPGGTIQFIDDTSLAVLGWADVATPSITVNNLTAGRHLIRADYSGTTDFLPLVVQPSQSELLPLTILVKPNVTLSSSPNPTGLGQLVTLTAMVTSKIGTPKGTVTFRDGRSVIAAHVGLDRGGIASFTTSTLTDGLRAIVAVYEGDGDHAAAVSQRLVLDAEPVRVSNTALLGTSATSASVTYP
jgi:hypothetical protein